MSNMSLARMKVLPGKAFDPTTFSVVLEGEWAVGVVGDDAVEVSWFFSMNDELFSTAVLS